MKNLKFFSFLAGLILVATTLSSCSLVCTTIQQNCEGVAIHRTEKDSSKVYEPVSGRMFTFFDWNTDYIEIPMYQQKGSLAHEEVKTSDRSTEKVDLSDVLTSS